MAIKINSELRNGKMYITSCSYPPVKDKFEEWTPETGILLSESEGFYMPFEFALVSSKMYSAICDHGLKTLADEVLSCKHRSLVTPYYIWDYIGKYSKRTPTRSTYSSYAKALKRLRNTLKVNEKIKPLTIEEATHKIPSQVSAGFPYIKTHAKYDKDEIMTKYLKEFEMQWERIAAGKIVIFPDCAAYASGKICDSEINEVRPTWQMPISIVLQETRYASPLIQAFMEQKCCRNAAYGCEILKGGMMWLNNEISLCNQRNDPTKIFLPNYTDFDASIPAWLIHDVFNIVMEKFELTPDDKVKFKECINYFIYTPIRNVDGKRYLKTHGIPSGSMFTDIIGTLVNMVISWCSSNEVYKSNPLLDFFFSDNSILCYHKNVKIDVLDYANFLRKVFGITMNVDESYWTYDIQKISFFGYYNFNGMAYKSSKELIAKMLYPQQLNDKWESFLSKSLDCLITSAGCSYDVFEVCQAVVWQAIRAGADIDAGVQMTRKNPRSLRHSIILGFHHLNISSLHFSNYNLTVPTPTCSKFKLGVHLIK
ncbi:hypothetical protein M0804_002813 [Polistes exclamans]|nr:hypothetical protein M0804_002813 [Polistes exclamans]